MATLVLIRHGRSTANAAGLLTGRAEGVALDDFGRRQATELKQQLRDVTFAGTYRSPVQRCEETATLLGWPDAVVHEGLTECDYGEWTNRELKVLTKEPMWELVANRPSEVRFPGGESMAGMAERVAEAMSEIAGRHGDRDVVALVSHGDPIKAMLSHALGQDLDLFQRINVAPASVSVVHMSGERPPAVLCINANTDLGALLAVRGEPKVGGGDIGTTAE